MNEEIVLDKLATMFARKVVDTDLVFDEDWHAKNMAEVLPVDLLERLEKGDSTPADLDQVNELVDKGMARRHEMLCFLSDKVANDERLYFFHDGIGDEELWYAYNNEDCVDLEEHMERTKSDKEWDDYLRRKEWFTEKRK